jgi:hypothetical protein
MPEYTIKIPDGLVPGLNKLVGRYNADSGTDWDVSTWLAKHVAELAMNDELTAERERLQLQAQADVRAGLEALRERMLSDAGVPA